MFTNKNLEDFEQESLHNLRVHASGTKIASAPNNQRHKQCQANPSVILSCQRLTKKKKRYLLCDCLLLNLDRVSVCQIECSKKSFGLKGELLTLLC
ncbi:hypothetical protein BpHYR1_017292 [Brachionus plicatilis]|uniref:Uncharacterized protein n=1 Tax=Brachionus plicatilis TaxID=10195 RepID=A0A3M7QW02_BRAPC|nr:hypothetical protein BpHYR1_017292 [Brachionus plicatilis]